MANFNALTSQGVNSDILFPGLRGGDYHIITQTADNLTIKYLDQGDGLPGGNMTVTFHGSAFTYDAENFPDGGTVDSITLSSGIINLAQWSFDAPVGVLNHYFKAGLTPEILNDLDHFDANNGDDRLVGHGNQDEFYGYMGNDTIVLGLKSSGSTINGGSGYDTVEVQASVGLGLTKVTNIEALTFKALFDTSVNFYVGDNGYQPLPSNFHVTGDSHVNSIEFSPIYADFPVSLNLSGFTFANWNSAADSVTINGALAADTLIGSRVSDHINGDLGDDLIRGGLGRDFLAGDGGHDIFDFNSIKESRPGAAHRDKIMDFQRGTDDIDLRTIDAKTGAGNQTFEFIGKHGFHDVKGELRYKDLGSKVIVQGDTNGDGHADFEIWVKAGALNAHDFLL